MPTFSYIAASSSAGAGPPVIEAPDRASAVRSLMARGITPTKIEVLGSPAAPPSPAGAAAPAPKLAPQAGPRFSGEAGAHDRPSRPRRGSMSLAETASFIRELATAVQAGLPMMSALRTLAKSGRSAGQRAMLAHLIARVEHGASLADACQSWGRPFDELLVNLVKAGEASGRLGDTLYQGADLLERELHLRRSVMSATLYPVILCVLTFAAVMVVTTFIMPGILQNLAAGNRQLPLPTRMVQGFAEFTSAYWWAMGLAGAGVYILWRRARSSPGPRLVIDEALVKLPLFGPLLRDAAVARFTRTLGTLVKSGLPVLGALRLTGATMTNHALRHAVAQVCEQVAAGKTIAEPLERTGHFPPLLVQIVSLGERSGRLAELLTQAATALEDRTQTRVKIFTTVLPPVLVVVLACIVGLVVAAILLPLLEMQETIG